MLELNLKRMPYIKCINIWRKIQNVEEFVDIWV